MKLEECQKYSLDVQSLPVREVWIEIYISFPERVTAPSLPVREVWIEIHTWENGSYTMSVTSREGSVD